MKKWARILFLTIFTISIFGSFNISAMEDSTTSVTAEEQQKVQEDTKAADYQALLKERLAKNKEVAQTSLTKAQQARIKSKCKSAQGKITSINANIKSFRTARIEVYDKVVVKLSALSTRLKDAGADTTELDKQIAELQTLVDSFKTNATELNQAAADLANMDCTADPGAFRAALEVMRTKRKSVADDSAAIRAYITDTIKPTLQTIRASISKTDETEGN